MLFPGALTVRAPAGLASACGSPAPLARGQRLHLEGVVGVLGGRAEPLGKASEERQVRSPAGRQPAGILCRPPGRRGPRAPCRWFCLLGEALTLPPSETVPCRQRPERGERGAAQATAPRARSGSGRARTHRGNAPSRVPEADRQRPRSAALVAARSPGRPRSLPRWSEWGRRPGHSPGRPESRGCPQQAGWAGRA